MDPYEEYFTLFHKFCYYSELIFENRTYKSKTKFWSIHVHFSIIDSINITTNNAIINNSNEVILVI